jgi:hypothetical protein
MRAAFGLRAFFSASLTAELHDFRTPRMLYLTSPQSDPRYLEVIVMSMVML